MIVDWLFKGTGLEIYLDWRLCFILSHRPIGYIFQVLFLSFGINIFFCPHFLVECYLRIGVCLQAVSVNR